MHSRRGVSIIEVLVALFVLSIGLLGTVSAAGAAARLIADGHRFTRLAAAATGMLEELHHTGCVAAAGQRVVAPFAFTWTVHRSPRDVEIHLSARHETARGVRQTDFVAARSCP
jgi:prepilin-type N-terminal cleavage/methylation domain-containing protein